MKKKFDEVPLTKVVPLPATQPVDWTPRRKVWVGATAGTMATAMTVIGVWVCRENGIDIPIEVGGSIGVFVTGLMTVATSFVSSYWVTEPPTTS